jgi:hypothetical protein
VRSLWRRRFLAFQNPSSIMGLIFAVLVCRERFQPRHVVPRQIRLVAISLLQGVGVVIIWPLLCNRSKITISGVTPNRCDDTLESYRVAEYPIAGQFIARCCARASDSPHCWLFGVAAWLGVWGFLFLSARLGFPLSRKMSMCFGQGSLPVPLARV